MRKVLWVFLLFRWGLEMFSDLVIWDDVCHDFNLGICKVRYIEVISISIPTPKKKRFRKGQAEIICQLEPRFPSASSYSLNCLCSEKSLSLAWRSGALNTAHLVKPSSTARVSGGPFTPVKTPLKSPQTFISSSGSQIPWIPAACALLSCSPAE